MAIRTQVTALVLLTSAALCACTAGAAGDAPTPASTDFARDDDSLTPAAPAAPAAPDAPKHRGRPHMPIEMGRLETTAVIAKLSQGTTATISTNATSYAYGASITVTFGGMDTAAGSWVGFAPQGSASTLYSWYAYTEGSVSGTANTVADLPPGTYVARAYFGTSYDIKGESAAFTVSAPSPAPGTTVTVAAGAGGTNEVFGGFESISVSFSGLTANKAYDVGIFPEHGANSLPYAWVSATTNGEGAGSASLTELLSGVTYDVRVFDGTTWALRGTTRFRVNPAVRATKSSFASNDAIEIEFAGMQGLSFVDKVQLATAGGAAVETQSVDWYWSGKRTFARPAPGSYIARIFNGVGDTTTAQATSAAFEVQ